MEQPKQEEDYGYDLFPERNSAKYKAKSIKESLFTFNHKCQVMLQFAMETSECLLASKQETSSRQRDLV